MDKELILLNTPSQLINKDNINKLIIEINKCELNKIQKELLLLASINLISLTKKAPALIYQLNNFKTTGQVYPTRSKSNYINQIIKELHNLNQSDYHDNIEALIDYIEKTNLSLKI